MSLKQCKSCGQEKPESSYALLRGKPRGQCNDCRNAQARASYRRNAESVKERKRKTAVRTRGWRYGLSASQLQEMEQQAGGRCQACGDQPTNESLNVDHCHATGRVRGLLCRHCNLALGHAKDSVARLQALIAYLQPT